MTVARVLTAEVPNITIELSDNQSGINNAGGGDAGVGLDARVAMQIGRLGVVAGTLVAWEVGGVGSAAALAAQIGRLRLVADKSGA